MRGSWEQRKGIRILRAEVTLKSLNCIPGTGSRQSPLRSPTSFSGASLCPALLPAPQNMQHLPTLAIRLRTDQKGRKLEAGNVVQKGNRMTAQTVQVFMATRSHLKEKVGG